MKHDRVTRAILSYGLLTWLAVVGFQTAANPSATAAFLGLDDYPWADRLFNCGIGLAVVALCVLAVHLLRTLLRIGRRRRPADAQRATSGVVIVEFTLILPIFFLVMSMVIQIALLANAALVVKYAAFIAARSAIVNLEYDLSLSRKLFSTQLTNQDRIDRSAYLVLATISPQAKSGSASTSDKAAAKAIVKIHEKQNGRWGSRSLVKRVNYAKQATDISKTPQFPDLIPQLTDLLPPVVQSGLYRFNMRLPQVPAAINNLIRIVQQVPAPPKEVSVTLEYQYLLTLPGLGFLPGIKDAPAGVSGRVFTITKTVRLQSSGPRQASLLDLAEGLAYGRWQW